MEGKMEWVEGSSLKKWLYLLNYKRNNLSLFLGFIRENIKSLKKKKRNKNNVLKHELGKIYISNQ